MQQKQRISVRPISGGIKDSRNPLLLSDGESPFCENVELNRESLKEVGGVVKFNNQAAPPGCIRTVAPEEHQPLTSRVGTTNVSVPMRGYVNIPYSREQDIGGQVQHGTDSYDDYRGRSFDLKVSFKIPDGTKLYGPSGTTGQNYYGNGNEALGECFIIAQKGGDRFQAMSWALGVVNVGDNEVYDMITGGSNFGESKSTYRLVFMWLDAPEFSFADPAATNVDDGSHEGFKYSLTDSSSAATIFGTLAYRSFVVDHAIDVGTEYHVSLSLEMDSGTVADANTAFNDDGKIKVNVAEGLSTAPNEYTYTVSGAGNSGSASGLHVWTGPQDSLNYFARYGVRYQGRDDMYLGLGQRMIPFIPGGSVPFGMDASPLEHGGFSMNTIAGVKTYMDANVPTADAAVLGTITRGSGDGFFTISRRMVTSGGTTNSLDVLKSPFGVASYNSSGPSINYGAWQGQGKSSTIYNSEALRGYHVVESSSSVKRISTISSYSESGSDYKLNCFDLDNASGTLGATEYFMYPFRWHQRDLLIADFRIYAKQGAYTADRAKWGLRSSIDLTDDNEPNIENLVGYWPLDDGGGGVCKDMVAANDAYLAPMQMGVSKRGTRGDNQIYLSGEGEAICLDLSENPIFEREFLENLRNDNMGIAVQVTMKLTGAEYSVQQVHPDPEIAAAPQLVAAWGPPLIQWAVKDAAGSGMASDPNPILNFGYMSRSANTANDRYRSPLGFALEVADQMDQSAQSMHSAIDNADQFDKDGVPWAGKTITFQVGIQPGSSAGTFKAYVAGAPAGLLVPEATLKGNDPNGEYVLYTSDFSIEDKDLSRSVITIGGGWEPSSYGYLGTNARMIVDEVRVFAAPAPGALPAASGDIINDRSGKILGSHSLPLTELREEDLLHDLGLGVSQVDVTDGSATVKATSSLEFYKGDPESTDKSVESAYLRVAQDKHLKREKDKLGVEQEEFYRIKSVTGSASSTSGQSEITLHTPYEGQSLTNINAQAFRVVGYTSFADGFEEVGLPSSVGKGFDPGTATVDDAILSTPLWTNRAPVTGDWRVRLYSPLSGMSIHDVAPSWEGGIVEGRRNPIRGLHSLNDKLYAQAGSTVFEVDDRWRKTTDGSDTLTWLEFRSQEVGVDRLHAPLAGDRLVFTDMDEVNLNTAQTNPSTDVHRTRLIDFEVDLNETRGLQTVYQCVNTDTYPGHSAATDKWEMNHWVRFQDGLPQLVLGCDVAYDGSGNKPPQNLWVASADAVIRAGERTHIRWIIEDETGSDDRYLQPICCVNGKKVDVTVSATQHGLSGTEWISSGCVVPTSNKTSVLVGCAVDLYEENTTDTAFTVNEMRGDYLTPKHHSGYLHSLNGKLRKLRIANDADLKAASNTTDASYNFNWRNISYASLENDLLNLVLDEGVGHKAKCDATSKYGVIYSKPFVPLYGGMEKRDQQAAMTAVGDAVYCTNGGRPVVIDQDFGAKVAGVLPPKGKPDAEIERLPLWQLNDETTPVDNDPVSYHYTTRGNSHLLCRHHEDMNWESGDVWAFKCYLKPNSVHGRIPIYSGRTSLENGGPFLEIVDGKCRLGWYDTILKKEVYVETSNQVFYPGYWHYVYVRKNYPDGTWQNQLNFENASECNDMMVVRVFNESSVTALSEEWRTNMVEDLSGSPAATNQMCVSYTMDYRYGWTVSGSTSGFKITITGGGDAVANYDVSIAAGSYNAVTMAAAIQTGIRGSGAVDATTCVWNPAGYFVIDSIDGTGITIAARGSGTDMTTTLFGGTTDQDTEASTWTGAAAAKMSFTASGLCSTSTTTWDGDTGGVVVASQDTMVDDHYGKYFQWDTSVDPEIYILAGSASSKTQFSLATLAGTTPDFGNSKYDGIAGGIFHGTELVASEDFFNSKNPDGYPFDIELFGSEMAAYPMSGVTPFNGSFASFGCTVTTKSSGHVFDADDGTDQARTGTDAFTKHPDDTDGNGPLVFDKSDGDTFVVVQSTTPNDELEVAMDAEASDNADPLTWQNSSSIQMLQGFRRVRVTFYDADQNIESNPGPELLIEPSEEDKTNTSGAARIRIKDIPLSPQKGNITRRIYMSQADGANLYEVAELADNSSDSIVIYKDELAIGAGAPLSFDRNAPPKCDIVKAAGGFMWYGGLAIQRNGALFSKPFQPTAVPFSNFLLFDTGDNSPITGIAEHSGRVLVFKRDSVYGVNVTAAGATQETISRGAGAVNHNSIQQLDDRLYFVDVRGIMHMAPFGEPQRISEEIEVFLNEDWDVAHQQFVVGGINRRRNQYLFATKEATSNYPDVRYACELLGGGSVLQQDVTSLKHRFSRFRGPNITALGTVWDRFGDNQQVVAGTEEGFVLWMDRTDTKLSMLGPDANVWGATSLTLTTSSDVAYLETSAGTIDTDLSGMRGAVVRYRTSSASSDEYESVVLGSVGTTLILDRSRTVAVTSGDTVIMGATRPQFRTKWFDMGAPELGKKSVLLDVSRATDGSGSLTFTTHKDFSDSAIDTISMSMTSGLGHESTTAQGAVLQVRFAEPRGQSGTEFEIVDMVWRVQVTDTW